MEAADTYKTVAGNAEAKSKDKGSKFIAYCYHVEGEEEIKEHLACLRKEYFDATHHCYAWRLGPKGENFRANDDGEPSGTAGRPILGQMLSAEVTDTLIVVVRYFGGTKLGVPGLIAAYKEAAAGVLAEAEIVELTVNRKIGIKFGYLAMNDVMRIVKEIEPEVVSQRFDNDCEMTLSIRESLAEVLLGRLSKVEGLKIEE